MSRDLNALWYDWLRARVQELAPTSLSGVASGTGQVIEFGGLHSGVTIYEEWSPGASAGVVVVETAPYAAYAGTWHLLGTLNEDAGKAKFSRVAGSFLAVRARVTTPLAGTIGAVVFDGAGLNDATSGGTYTLAADAVFVVEIDGAGTPDTFKWSKDGGAYTETVAITGSAQTLSDGVTVTFGATTGHTAGDIWTITVSGGRVTVTLVKEP